MQPTTQAGQARKLWGLALISLFLLVVYGNTFRAGWHLDDFPNIISNSRLHMEALSVDAVKQAFTAQPSDPGNTIWRPLPCFSLALNWYWGQDDPFGYHLVNLILHMLTASVLFLSVRLLLQAPAITIDLTSSDRHFIALLAACLWALNPIHTQAVTYVIQRMAVMAALFSILGIYAYLKTRLGSGKMRWTWGIAAVLFFVCALLSKENAVLFPFSLMLIEVIFFLQRMPFDGFKALWTPKNGLIAGAVMIVLVAVIVLNTTGNPINFGYYAKRPFTMMERLASQPRILLFYLSLLAYPAPWRFSIEHDINHSLSLITPWTTLPAIVAVLGLITTGILLGRKHPLVSFAILFYFLNHLVESTILPLELVFEHRNYLPSFFLFVPVAYGINLLVTRYRGRHRMLLLLVTVSISMVLFATGLACHDRNKAWQSDYSLWYDAFRKAPNRARALMGLGVAIGWGEQAVPNRYDIAMQLFKRGLTLPNARNNEKAQLYGNIGLIHATKGELPRAVGAYHQALDISPVERKIRFDLVQALIAQGSWHDADAQLDILLADEIAPPSELGYKGLVKLWLDDPQAALDIFQKVLHAGYRDAFIYQNIAVAMARLDYLERGQWFLQRALDIVEAGSRGRMLIFFSLMENRYMADDVMGAKSAAYRLLAEYGLDEILDTLRQIPIAYNYPPLDAEVVSRILSRNLMDITTTF